jgi:hypothetical protein
MLQQSGEPYLYKEVTSIRKPKLFLDAGLNVEEFY